VTVLVVFPAASLNCAAIVFTPSPAGSAHVTVGCIGVHAAALMLPSHATFRSMGNVDAWSSPADSPTVTLVAPVYLTPPLVETGCSTATDGDDGAVVSR